MDLQAYAKKVETVLRAAAVEMETIHDLDQGNSMWGFELEDETSGFVLLVDKTATFDKPVVVVSFTLGPLDDASEDDLKDLLALNGELHDACLTITPPMGDDDEEFLMLQTRFPAVEFSAERFAQALSSLRTQYSLFFEEE
ncbi:hypothetical protein MASR1M90_06790 [Desulfovibrionales bacterium]